MNNNKSTKDKDLSSFSDISKSIKDKIFSLSNGVVCVSDCSKFLEITLDDYAVEKFKKSGLVEIFFKKDKEQNSEIYISHEKYIQIDTCNKKLFLSIEDLFNVVQYFKYYYDEVSKLASTIVLEHFKYFSDIYLDNKTFEQLEKGYKKKFNEKDRTYFLIYINSLLLLNVIGITADDSTVVGILANTIYLLLTDKNIDNQDKEFVSRLEDFYCLAMPFIFNTCKIIDVIMMNKKKSSNEINDLLFLSYEDHCKFQLLENQTKTLYHPKDIKLCYDDQHNMRYIHDRSDVLKNINDINIDKDTELKGVIIDFKSFYKKEFDNLKECDLYYLINFFALLMLKNFSDSFCDEICGYIEQKTSCFTTFLKDVSVSKHTPCLIL